MERTVEHDKLNHLESRYMHLDARVGSISEDVSSMKATLGGVVDALNRLANDLKPQPVSVATWLGVGFVTISMLGSMVWGVQSYVSLQMTPVLARVAKQEEITRERADDIVAQAYKNGRLDGKIELLTRMIEDIDKYGSRRWMNETPSASVYRDSSGVWDDGHPARAYTDGLHNGVAGQGVPAV